MSHGTLLILTGAPGAGKSTIARLLCEASDAKAAHIHTDDFFAYVKKGYIAPWLPAAYAQNETIMQAAAETACAYARGGYFTVADGIVGSWYLPPFRAVARRDGLAIDYVVLKPALDVAVARGIARTAKHAMRDEAVIAQMWQHLAELGDLERHALDNGALDAGATVAAIRAGLGEGRFRLA